jgi:hypothetical protein
VEDVHKLRTRALPTEPNIAMYIDDAVTTPTPTLAAFGTVGVRDTCASHRIAVRLASWRAQSSRWPTLTETKH